MVNGLNDIISRLMGLFQWWIVVAPWERAIRVRSGKAIRVLGPGLHFRIPGLDRFFVQGIRQQLINAPTQAITEPGGQTVTISGGLSYCIDDISKLYDTLGEAEDVIQLEVMALIARYVSTHKITDGYIEALENNVNSYLELDDYGLADYEYRVTDFCCVRTYRLIQSYPKDYTMGGLTTKAETKPGVNP